MNYLAAVSSTASHTDGRTDRRHYDANC